MILHIAKIKSLQILDATFDDVLPLAIKTMSPSLEGLVRNIIRDYFNLNIAEQLNRYNILFTMHIITIRLQCIFLYTSFFNLIGIMGLYC